MLRMLLREPLIIDIVGMLTIHEIKAFKILKHQLNKNATLGKEIAKWNFKSMKPKLFPFNDVNSMQLLPLMRIIENWKKPRPFRNLAEISKRKCYDPVGPKDTNAR